MSREWAGYQMVEDPKSFFYGCNQFFLIHFYTCGRPIGQNKDLIFQAFLNDFSRPDFDLKYMFDVNMVGLGSMFGHIIIQYFTKTTLLEQENSKGLF